jgi:hypothetical protein
LLGNCFDLRAHESLIFATNCRLWLEFAISWFHSMTDNDELAQAIRATEDRWKIERGLEGLGRLLPRRARRVLPDQVMVDDYLRGDFDEVRRRGKAGGGSAG